MARPNEESEVIGHYLVSAQGRPAQPLLHESTALFQDVVSDKLSTVEGAIEADSSKLNQFFLILHWGSDVKAGTGPGADLGAESSDAGAAAAKASVTVKQRTLLMIAAHAGSLRVLAYLLARGSEPSRKSPDGLTAYDFAIAGESSQAATAVAMMRDADAHPPTSTRSSSTTETHSFSGTDAMRKSSMQSCGPDLTDSDGSAYCTTDLTRPEYSTDDFRMFNFKVLRCSKRHAHDWRACPFAHPTENARRRDPREFKYCALACPDYKQGFCIRGDMCPYAHGVFECWLHPSRYRTQLCKDGANCHRPVCFFAHSLPELRAPTYTWVPGPADLARPAASQAASGGAGTAGAGASATPAAAGSTVFSTATAAVAAANGVSLGGNSPSAAAAAEAEARALLSHSSSGLPAGLGSSSDSVGGPASCGSPRAVGTASSAIPSGNSVSSGCGAGLANGTAAGGSADSMVALLIAANGGSIGALRSGGVGGGVGAGGSVLGVGGSVGVNGAAGAASPQGSVASIVKEGSMGAAVVLPGKSLSASAAVGSNGCYPGSPPTSSASGAAGGGSGGKANPNLTQPNAAAGMLGFTAPRMSNAFARRHGLNPKDNPMLNLQKIALQSHQQQQQTGMGGYQQDATASAYRSHAAAANGALHLGGAGGRGGLANGGGAGYNGTGGGSRLHAAAAAAASGGSTHAAPFVPYATPGGGAAFPLHLQMHAAGHLGGAGHAEQSLLAAQLAALNLQQQQQVAAAQRQQYLSMGMGLGGIAMANGAAAAAAAAMGAAAGIGHGPIPYMTAAAPHHALLHAGMYGPGGAGMYDHTQQHLMAAMSGTQTEV